MPKFSLKSKLPQGQREELLFDFFRSLSCVKNSTEAARIFSDLLSPPELDMLAKRLAIARLLIAGVHYQKIMKELKVSNSTIARVNFWLQESGEGFRLVFDRIKPRRQFRDGQTNGERGGLELLKRKYPLYFWPQLVLEEILKSANRKELANLRMVINKSRAKTQLLRRIDRILKSSNSQKV